MKQPFAESVYYTLTNELIESYQVPGVENIYADDAPCSKLYQEVYEANIRLCERLGQLEDDPDVELIINNLLEIGKQIGLKMFYYGQKFSHPAELQIPENN